MEMFSALYQWNIRTLGFDFHPKCQEIQLSHLVFADDLFLISAATTKSFEVIKKTMLEFGSMFGLSPNLQKCQIFIAGLDAQEADSSRDIMQMPRRMLPVKYLGLPLISSRLSYKDCHPIFIKMEQKIKSWANKKLSYGGRLQLIQSVLTRIYLHWCSVFIVVVF